MQNRNILRNKNNEEVLFDSINRLYIWVKKEDYKGWDPYDALSGDIAKYIAKSNLLKFLLIQFNLYSPVNFRPTFRIDKNISNKSIALFIQAYLNIFKLTGLEKFKQEALCLLEYLEDKSLEGHTDYCWSSYYYEFIGVKHALKPSVPDIVGTTSAINAFLLAYELTNEEKYMEIAGSAIHYLISELLEVDTYGYHFKYTPNEQEKIVFNVSALALSGLSKFLIHTNKIELVKIINGTTAFLIKYPMNNGAWPYSLYKEKNIFYKQIDFHQGFILDGLYSSLPYLTKENKEKARIALKKGVDFYKNKQFTKEGYCYYRYPFKYPIDIHNQAQGIITFSKLSELNDEYLDFAKKIFYWTVKNMRSKEGYFYTHKWPCFITNKIPHMRWGQAWMMLAMATLLRMISLSDSDICLEIMEETF